MGTPYIGEIRMFGGNFAPAGWEFCAGQLVPISENEALFNLIGTTYGGDGQTTFALPDLRGRVPVHQGTGPGLSTFVMGQTAGAENITLSVPQIPSHTHTVNASSNGATTTTPASDVVPARAVGNIYDVGADTALAPGAVGMQGGSQPHNNMQPYICINYIISMFGIYPSQT